ncbi:MAG TPA: M48 family metalloprotease [Candidatus Binatia bacterium]
MARIAILLLVLSALPSCSALRPLAGASTDAVARDAVRVARLERLGRALAPAEGTRERLTFALSSRDELGAWSWPDGRVRVSRALVDLLDDDELAAVLAHELGHLLDGDGASDVPAALAGDQPRRGPEARADAIGCTLLATRGLPAEALPTMLRRLADAIAHGAAGPDPTTLLQRARVADAICSTTRAGASPSDQDAAPSASRSPGKTFDTFRTT